LLILKWIITIMKEIVELIEQLHKVNQKIVEKDNMIDKMSAIIQVVSEMINDQTLNKSEIYQDIRAKYINQIEDKMKHIQGTQLTIEPGMIDINIPSRKNNSNVFTKEQINAPILTDIFVAPKCRKVFVKTKKDEVNSVKSEKKEKYVSFEHKNKTYYIHEDTNNDGNHDIYDSQLSIAGQLVKDTITIITDNQQLSSEIIKLNTINESPKKKLFGLYGLQCVS